MSRSGKKAEKQPWIREGTEEMLVDSPVVKVVRQLYRRQDHPEPRTHRFYKLISPDWCNVIPITESGAVVFVRQFRVGPDQMTLELPGGIIDATDADISAAALREMTEETGFTAGPDAQLTSLGWTHPNPAMQGNRCFSFVIGPVRQTHPQKLDPGEDIEVVEVPISEIPERLRNGEISHALMQTAFFRLALHAGRDLESSLREYTCPR
ncbi:MAG: NUDIX hydrolase [Bacteriovoracia bacterium]